MADSGNMLVAQLAAVQVIVLKGRGLGAVRPPFGHAESLNRSAHDSFMHRSAPPPAEDVGTMAILLKEFSDSSWALTTAMEAEQVVTDDSHFEQHCRIFVAAEGPCAPLKTTETVHQAYKRLLNAAHSRCKLVKLDSVRGPQAGASHPIILH
jgi:hypothetical protein